MKAAFDYLGFCDSERYLLNQVGPVFRATGRLNPVDFMAILIWKAERAKNHHKKRLKSLGNCTFAEAVSQISKGIHQSTSPKDRLKYLMDEWWFQLPTATAVLTILYPEDFTVFDWRVCDEVRINYEPWHYRGFSEGLWEHYLLFKKTVEAKGPQHLSLRDKDRFFIGRSYRKSIAKDCL